MRYTYVRVMSIYGQYLYPLPLPLEQSSLKLMLTPSDSISFWLYRLLLPDWCTLLMSCIHVSPSLPLLPLLPLLPGTFPACMSYALYHHVWLCIEVIALYMYNYICWSEYYTLRRMHMALPTSSPVFPYLGNVPRFGEFDCSLHRDYREIFH